MTHRSILFHFRVKEGRGRRCAPCTGIKRKTRKGVARGEERTRRRHEELRTVTKEMEASQRLTADPTGPKSQRYGRRPAQTPATHVRKRGHLRCVDGVGKKGREGGECKDGKV
ncbi:hypothetical protein NDU88_005380 [Pleurodeles waltl]|uniref:Uncharacterized protein n=1 Tax=Pleurodeles waltl TaxID=8319 RepID=A0AAV7LPE1_PLEWA|nr:hypothetical protein NDU88_005380 [Pleurodeles waltl]